MNMQRGEDKEILRYAMLKERMELDEVLYGE